MNILNKVDLKPLIEPHFHNNLNEDEYEIINKKSNKLLTYNRFDLAFKLLYLEMFKFNLDFAKDTYTEHIRAFSLGDFKEPGNNNKNNIENFIEDFNLTYTSIKNYGFDYNKTIIPLSNNGSISNGAHRVASAIFLDKNIDCVKINTNNHIYDYKFFYERNVSNEILDNVATTFIEYSDNVHIAFLWPAAVGFDKEIEEIIPNIVYRKEVKLSSNGAHNLLSQIYYGEKWIGNVEDNFYGSTGKLVECFTTYEPFRVIAFQADNLNEVIKIKNNVRDVFNIGKHSIHITDTKEEAVRVARVVFNDNSLHFLNYSKPNKYISTHKKMNRFKEFMKKNNLNNKEVILDSSIVLSAYGIREARDTDYFVINNDKVKYSYDKIDIHDDELKYYNNKKIEIIYNSVYYFYFNDLKFISFTQLYKMKTKRGEIKDINDCKMMEALIENNKLKEIINKVKQIILYSKIKLRSKGPNFLRDIGLYKTVRFFYRLIKSFK